MFVLVQCYFCHSRPSLAWLYALRARRTTLDYSRPYRVCECIGGGIYAYVTYGSILICVAASTTRSLFRPSPLPRRRGPARLGSGEGVGVASFMPYLIRDNDASLRVDLAIRE